MNLPIYMLGSCLAGESIHFYDEVSELSNIPVTDPVTRVYMARHIIEKYIDSGGHRQIPLKSILKNQSFFA